MNRSSNPRRKRGECGLNPTPKQPPTLEPKPLESQTPWRQLLKFQELRAALDMDMVLSLTELFLAKLEANNKETEMPSRVRFLDVCEYASWTGSAHSCVGVRRRLCGSVVAWH